MDINISEANQFISLHAHPKDVNGDDLELIDNWILTYPYCQSLHFLATQAAKQRPDAENHLAKAAAFAPDRTILYQFVNEIETFETEVIALEDDINVLEPLASEEGWVKDDLGQAFGADLNDYKVEENEVKGGKFEAEIIESAEPQETSEENVPITKNEAHLHFEDVEGNEGLENVDEDEVTEDPELTIEENLGVETVEHQEMTDEVLAEETEEEPFRESVEEIKDPEEETAFTDVSLENTELENTEETKALALVGTDEPVAETEPDVQISENPTEESAREEEAPDLAAMDEVVEAIDKFIDNESIEAPVAVKDQAAERLAGEPFLSANQEEIIAETDESDKVKESENIVRPIVEPEEESLTEASTPLASDAELSANIETENVSKNHTSKEELIFESPIASDFFAFAKSEKPEPLPVTTQAQKEEELVAAAKEEVSQYHDERLPYTFLWWLSKTRKEHAINTQPYAKKTSVAAVQQKTAQTTAGERSLNHQIAENIFHLRGADDINVGSKQNQTVPFDFRRKEFQIIEKFIKEEPQIKPPAADKIDTENKAKKSSEDANQVVSETLAKIYVEQMLYHKALDVYKKLSLKYPEKSTYFASQIKYLELKVN